MDHFHIYSCNSNCFCQFWNFQLSTLVISNWMLHWHWHFNLSAFKIRPLSHVITAVFNSFLPPFSLCHSIFLVVYINLAETLSLLITRIWKIKKGLRFITNSFAGPSSSLMFWLKCLWTHPAYSVSLQHLAQHLHTTDS